MHEGTDPSRQVQLQGLGTPVLPPCTPNFSGREENVASWSVDQNCGCHRGLFTKEGPLGAPPCSGSSPPTPASRRPPALGAQPSPAPAPAGQALTDGRSALYSRIRRQFRENEPLRTWLPIIQISETRRENAFPFQRPNVSST